MSEKLINKTKVCGKCNRILPVDNFYRDNSAKDGLQYWCKECKSEHNQAHKEHYNQYNKEYLKQFKGCYLYIIQDKNNEIVYVGQSKNYYIRLCQHLSGGVDSTKELFASGNWSCIKYLDVTDLVANEMELRYLENMLIELYNPRCNTLKNIIRDVDRGRLFSLLATLHSMSQEWEEFRTNI